MCMQENGALCQPQDLAWWKAWNWNWKKVQTCANMCLSEAVEQHKNTCLGTALEGEYASGGGPDRCAEELGAAAEGDAGVEAWQHECTCCQAHSNTGSFRPQWKIDLCNVYATRSDDWTVVCH